MFVFSHKLISFYRDAYGLILSNGSVFRYCGGTLTKIKKGLQLQKPGFFKNAVLMIKDYISESKGCNSKILEEDLLWRLAYRHQNFKSFSAILANDQKLLSIFKNSYDLLHFSDSISFSKILNFFCFDSNRSILLQQFNLIELFKILNSGCDSNVLEILVDNRHWQRLTIQYGFSTADIVKMSSHNGAAHVLMILLDLDNWTKLTQVYKLDTKSIVRIANNVGSRNVFDILLDSKYWNQLTNIYQLDCEQILKIVSHSGARKVLNILLDLDNWRLLTEVYQLDSHSIVKIANNGGARNVFEILLDADNWNQLTVICKIDRQSIVKIANHDGSRNVFNLLLNSKYWHRFTQLYKLDTESIVKIASHDGSRKVLEFLLNLENWQRLTEVYQLDLSSIVKIANVASSKNVFEILLNKDNWKFLTEVRQLDVLSIVKISSVYGAKRSLEIFLDPKKWKTFTEVCQFDIQDIVKIASYDGACNVFDVFLDLKKWKILIEICQFDVQSIVKIASHENAKHVFDIFLDFDKWKILTEICKLDVKCITKIAKHAGSKHVFDIFLNPKKWKTLTDVCHFDLESIVSVASISGSRNVFNIFLNSKKWKILTEICKFDVESIVNISSKTGARNVLEILLDSKKWKLLTEAYKLDVNSIVKVVSHCGARNVLDILLDIKNWRMLTKDYRFDIRDIVQISIYEGARSVFDCLLNPKNWKTLTEVYKLDVESIVGILRHHGAKHVLDILLNPDNWKTLTEVYQLDSALIVKIASNDGAKDVLDILLDLRNWHVLTQVRGLDRNLLVAISSQCRASHVLSVILDSDKYKKLCAVFGEKQLFSLFVSRCTSLHLDTFLQYYEDFRLYFNDQWMPFILRLPIKDQKVLLDICKMPLKNALHLDQKDYLMLVKISGKYLLYIFNLISSQSEALASLFSGYGLPLPTSIVSDSERLTLFSDKDFWVLTLVELHHCCLGNPLSLDDLRLLKNLLPPDLTHADRLAFLKRLLYFSYTASIKDRRVIWNAVCQRNWMNSDKWIRRLATFPQYLRTWFVVEGYDKIHRLLTSDMLEKSQFSLTSKDQHYLISCLKYPGIRLFIEQTVSEKIQIRLNGMSYSIVQVSKNKSQLSLKEPYSLTVLDWIYFVMMVYTLIDSEMDLYHQLGKAQFSAKSTQFSVQEIVAFKNRYPTFYFHEGVIFTSLSVKQLQAILKDGVLSDFKDNIRRWKRPSSCISASCVKRPRISKPGSQIELKDTTQFLTQSVWSSSESMGEGQLSEEISCRNGSVVDWTEDLLNLATGSQLSTCDFDKDKESSMNFEIPVLNDMDWQYILEQGQEFDEFDTLKIDFQEDVFDDES